MENLLCSENCKKINRQQQDRQRIEYIDCCRLCCEWSLIDYE